MRAKHFEAVFTPISLFHGHFIIGFIIISSYFIIIASRLAESELHPSSLTKSIAPRYCMLPLSTLDTLTNCACSLLHNIGARFELVDPDVTFTCPCARLNREIPPECELTKKAIWENRHISSIVHDIFYARFELWVPATFHASYKCFEAVFTAITS